MEIIEVINDLNSRIAATFDDFKGCYLYGSRARGDFRKGSDIDVVAIFEEIDNDKDFELSGIISDLLYKYDVYIDLQAYTSERLERNPIYYNEVVSKGIFYAPV